MSPQLHEFVTLDLPALAAATLAAITCALLGNFLLLRRQSLMGDAISHSVLPGLVVAFLLTGSRASLPMFIGAAAAGVITVVLVELVRRLGRVEPGAAMGVVFSIMFAIGVALIERAARSVDLDADCVLNGQLETIFWTLPVAPGSPVSAYFTAESLAAFPHEPLRLAAVALAAALFVGLFYKELRLAAFDPALASALGFSAGTMHFALMIAVAAAVVAAFEAVGSILVIAMLICPAATARLLTDRLHTQVWISLAVAVATAVGGYFGAVRAPDWLGTADSLGAAGMITVLGGAVLAGAVLFSPTHGVAARSYRRASLSVSIAVEDLLAMFYRVEEASPPPDHAGTGAAPLPEHHAIAALGGGLTPRLALALVRRRGLVTGRRGALMLTDSGRARARSLIRTHRLWETYLVQELGLRADHVHRTAMELEHLTTPNMQRRLRPPPDLIDPQGKPIPGSPDA